MKSDRRRKLKFTCFISSTKYRRREIASLSIQKEDEERKDLDDKKSGLRIDMQQRRADVVKLVAHQFREADEGRMLHAGGVDCFTSFDVFLLHVSNCCCASLMHLITLISICSTLSIYIITIMIIVKHTVKVKRSSLF